MERGRGRWLHPSWRLRIRSRTEFRGRLRKGPQWSTSHQGIFIIRELLLGKDGRAISCLHTPTIAFRSRQQEGERDI